MQNTLGFEGPCVRNREQIRKVRVTILSTQTLFTAGIGIRRGDDPSQNSQNDWVAEYP